MHVYRQLCVYTHDGGVFVHVCICVCGVWRSHLVLSQIPFTLIFESGILTEPETQGLSQTGEPMSPGILLLGLQAGIVMWVVGGNLYLPASVARIFMTEPSPWILI